jgi:hypothetical protein
MVASAHLLVEAGTMVEMVVLIAEASRMRREDIA